MALGARGRCHRSWDPQSPLLSAGAVDTGQPLSSLKPRLGLQVNPTCGPRPPGLRQLSSCPSSGPGTAFPELPSRSHVSRGTTWRLRSSELGKGEVGWKGPAGATAAGSLGLPKVGAGLCGAVRGRSFRDLGWERVGQGHSGHQPAWSSLRPQGRSLPERGRLATDCLSGHKVAQRATSSHYLASRRTRRPTKNLPSGPQGERRGAGPHRTHGPSPAPTLAPPAPTLAPVAR